MKRILRQATAPACPVQQAQVGHGSIKRKRIARSFSTTPPGPPPTVDEQGDGKETSTTAEQEGPRFIKEGALKNWQRWVRAGVESPQWVRHGEEVRAGREKTALDVLEERGLIKDIAGDRNALRDAMIMRRLSVYSGVDPTASSLHLGHLVPLNALFWLHHCGHHCTSLVGGFTAEIGDPTDRLDARAAIEKNKRAGMAESMKTQLVRLWRHATIPREGRPKRFLREDYGFREDLGPQRTIETNNSWLLKLTLREWLRHVAMIFKVGALLSRDSVKTRLARGDSMTLAELTYPSLQAYDWFHMFRHRSVEIQVGGSDQFGNIIAGQELIEHMLKHNPSMCNVNKPTIMSSKRKPFGITTPLMTTSSGEKFGKSAGNAIWLDPDLTPAFDLYGYLLRTSDADVERFLKLLTLVPTAEITTVMARHAEDPSKRKAQHLLAYEVCFVAHGRNSAEKTQEQHRTSRTPTLDSLLQHTPSSSSSSSTSSSSPDSASATSPASRAMAAEAAESAGEPASAPATKRSDSQSKSKVKAAPEPPPVVTPRAPRSASRAGDNTLVLPRSIIEQCKAAQVMVLVGIADSNSEATRMRKQGGLYVAQFAQPKGSRALKKGTSLVGKEAGTQLGAADAKTLEKAGLVSGGGPEGDGGEMEEQHHDEAKVAPRGELTYVQLSTDVRHVAKLAEHVIDGRVLVLRSGKWKTYVVEVVGDEEFDARGLRIEGLDRWRTLLTGT